MRQIEALGYRVGVGYFEGRWICTAKDDRSGQFHIARADGEEEAMAVLAEMVGIGLEDG